MSLLHSVDVAAAVVGESSVYVAGVGGKNVAGMLPVLMPHRIAPYRMAINS